MEELVLDGKKYVLASKAAEQAGYTRDYVGQLARGGEIDAHLVGRSWYVNADQLGVHRVEKKRYARIKAREQVKKAIQIQQEEQTAQPKEEPYYERHIQYEEDSSELIPPTRRLEIVSETPNISKKIKKATQSKKREKNYVIENEGDKILMSGKVKVVDATDEDALDEDTVFLHAHINKKKKKISPQTKARANEKLTRMDVHEDAEDAESEVTIHTDTKTDFTTKLQSIRLGTGNEGAFEEKEPLELSDDDTTEIYEENAESSIFIPIAVVFLSILMSITFVVLTAKLQYLNAGTGGSNAYYESGYEFKVKQILSEIIDKI